VLATYATGGTPQGGPAITRNTRGDGVAWYLGTRLDDASRARVLGRICADAGVSTCATPDGVEVVRRRHVNGGSSYLFVLNHSDRAATVAGAGVDLLTGVRHAGAIEVPAGGVVVVREDGR
jgi:beta-galactosidase